MYVLLWANLSTVRLGLKCCGFFPYQKNVKYVFTDARSAIEDVVLLIVYVTLNAYTMCCQKFMFVSVAKFVYVNSILGR